VIPNLAVYDARLSRQVSQMLTTEIAACCKELKLSRNMVEMADRVQAIAIRNIF